MRPFFEPGAGVRGSGAGDWTVLAASYLLAGLFALLCLTPFLLVLAGSVTDELSLITEGFRLLPRRIDLLSYRLVLASGVVTRAYGVTTYVTVMGTFLSLLVTSGLSYAISLRSLRYRNGIAFFVYFTMLFSGGLVPSYLLIAKYLHMKNSLWVLILPVLVNPWNMFLLRNFFKTVPVELSESARMDGATDLTILFRVVMPVSLPALATIGLFYALGYWNEWFHAMLYIERESLYPLQYLIMRIMRNIQFADEIAAKAGVTTVQLAPSQSARMATAVMTIGPIVFLYPFVQRYFVKGLMVGSIKG